MFVPDGYLYRIRLRLFDVRVWDGYPGDIIPEKYRTAVALLDAMGTGENPVKINNDFARRTRVRRNNGHIVRAYYVGGCNEA